MIVPKENLKEVLERDLNSGGSTRSTNLDPALFMDMAHLVARQLQAHLSHLEVMVFMSVLTQHWCLSWGDLENTKECSSHIMKYRYFILT